MKPYACMAALAAYIYHICMVAHSSNKRPNQEKEK